jgi:hypothetical protein
MDRVTQGNASQTEEMSATASSLLSHAVQLAELVGRFRLEEENDQPVPAKKSTKKTAVKVAPKSSTPAKRSSDLRSANRGSASPFSAAAERGNADMMNLEF